MTHDDQSTERSETDYSVPFWRTFSDRGRAVAVTDTEANLIWSYQMLNDRVQELADCLRRWPKAVLLLFAGNDIGGVIFYLAGLEAGHVLHLAPVSSQHPSAAALIDQFRPEIIVDRSERLVPVIEQNYSACAAEHGYQMFLRRFREEPAPHESLALLLSTSATTGSPKSARLSIHNVARSAAQVAEALHLSEGDRALLGLPISYVYGLSVLNSALQAGASIALVRGTPADREYWQRVAKSEPTLVPAVSQTLNYMRAMQIDGRELPSLRRVTHSGDALDPALLRWAQERLANQGISIYLMYGQTEACGRITVLPPNSRMSPHGSVGKAMRGGEIAIGADSEIIYRGPGVMWGYATQREDLILGNTLNGVLHTGDVGYLDSGGFLYITGRLRRYCKIFGHRVSLDEMEASIRARFPVAVIEKNGIIVVFVEKAADSSSLSAMHLARRFSLPPQSFQIKRIESLPRTSRGKIAYTTLLECA